jgi:hypothetical protein
MGVGIFFRLLSVIFARGWGMLDDHFLVIEAAQSWVDGYDYNAWLPWTEGNTGPTGHHLVYPGLNYLIFLFFRWIGLDDPQSKMMVIRFLNAAWSMVTVYVGYKLAKRIGTRETARLTGLLLAILWFMPWMSVRNLVEILCIPFLMISVWIIIKREDNRSVFITWLLSGICLGMAFNLRMQTAFFALGLGVAALILKKVKETSYLTLGFLLTVLLLQGSIGLYIWGTPFAELQEYVRYNMTAARDYFVLPWYTYLLFLAGVLIPPVSLLIFWGYLYSWRRHLLIFLPVAFFLVFHSAFPNKQERFILSVVPLLLVLGIWGWNEFKGRSSFWTKRPKTLKGFWIFFWVINLMLLPAVSVVYSKRAPVESMTYLSKYDTIRAIMVTDGSNRPVLVPRFYLGQWPQVYDELLEGETTDSMMRRVAAEPDSLLPRFLLFTGESTLQDQVLSARKVFPGIVYETTVEPGFIDVVMHKLNPVNRSQRIFIYRNTRFVAEKKES